MSARTVIRLSLAPDAMNDLLDLPFRYVPAADRLLEKINEGSMERFVERAMPVKHVPGRWVIARRADDAYVTFTCVVDDLINDADEVVAGAISVVGVQLTRWSGMSHHS